jgi:hypothetical protein
MRLSAKALAITSAALWGGGIFFVALMHIAVPGYGEHFLQTMSSVYPGYYAAPTLGSLLIGTAWAAGDGAVGGFLLAWIYNRFAEKEPQAK